MPVMDIHLLHLNVYFLIYKLLLTIDLLPYVIGPCIFIDRPVGVLLFARNETSTVYSFSYRAYC